MKINDELVQHIAHLARLEFEGDELNEIKGDMSKIIGFMDKLSELDTEDVEPLIFMTDKVNVLRDDKPERTLTSEDALRNAPKKDSDYFRISKVSTRNHKEKQQYLITEPLLVKSFFIVGSYFKQFFSCSESPLW